jgi:hypothetical protein
MEVEQVSRWNSVLLEYQKKKDMDRGSSSVGILNGRSKRSLYVITPEMKSWGISDWTDDTGKSNEKYTISLSFSNTNPEDQVEFLEKLKEFEEKILEDAVERSESWWGEKMTKDVLKHMYFPFLKYPKIPGTKKLDMSKLPSLRPKVPYYNGKWGDSFAVFSATNKEKLFPSETYQSPIDLIPKGSTVRCVIQFQSLWFGGKGWGVTVRAVQCVVKPGESYKNVNDFCQIDFSVPAAAAAAPTFTADSDDETDTPPQKSMTQPQPVEPAPQPVVTDQTKQPDPEPVAVPEPVAPSAPKKKIVKKGTN